MKFTCNIFSIFISNFPNKYNNKIYVFLNKLILNYIRIRKLPIDHWKECHMKIKCHLLIFHGIYGFFAFLYFEIQEPGVPELIWTNFIYIFFSFACKLPYKNSCQEGKKISFSSMGKLLYKNKYLLLSPNKIGSPTATAMPHIKNIEANIIRWFPLAWVCEYSMGCFMARYL